MSATPVKETLRPIGCRVLVRPDKPKEVTEGGIHLPTTKDRPLRGIVVAIGPGDKDTPAPVPVGAAVMYNKFAGLIVEVNGEALLSLQFTDLIGELCLLGTPS